VVAWDGAVGEGGIDRWPAGARDGLRVLLPLPGGADCRGHAARGDHVGFDCFSGPFADGRPDHVRVSGGAQRLQQRLLMPRVVAVGADPSIGRAPEP
jgi:hypothetical protein